MKHPLKYIINAFVTATIIIWLSSTIIKTWHQPYLWFTLIAVLSLCLVILSIRLLAHARKLKPAVKILPI